jgi:hypothetical protein
VRRGTRGYTAQVVKGNAKAAIAEQDPATLLAPQIAIPEPSPTAGERTTALKFLDYRPVSSSTSQLSLEGLGGLSYTFAVCANGSLAATGATVVRKSGCWSDLTVRFDGDGYHRTEVILRSK